jgi:hypothetical protein
MLPRCGSFSVRKALCKSHVCRPWGREAETGTIAGVFTGGIKIGDFQLFSSFFSDPRCLRQSRSLMFLSKTHRTNIVIEHADIFIIFIVCFP